MVATSVVKSMAFNPTKSVVKTKTPINGVPLPNTATPFDMVVSKYKVLRDYLFGTSAVAGVGQIAIKNITDLDTYFLPYAVNAGQYVINSECQRYKPFTNTNNFVFASDALELTATFQNPSMHRTVQASPTSNVVNSQVVPLADTTNFKVGQVVGFGAESMTNFGATRIVNVGGTIGTGDTIVSTFTDTDYSSFTPVVITTTAGSGDTAAVMVAAHVAAINANATLQSAGIYAVIAPTLTSTYYVTQPVQSTSVPNEWGDGGKAGCRRYATSFTKTGGVTHDYRQEVTFTHIIAKTAGSITLSKKVNLTTSSVITGSKSSVFHVQADSFNTATLNIGDSSGASVGQIVQLSYQDPNPRRIISTNTGAGTITLDYVVWVGQGLLCMVYDMYMAITTATVTNGNVLTFAAVPSGVQVGHQIFDYYSTSNQRQILVTAVTATTVTISSNITSSSGATIAFTPAIDSAQIWTKELFRPHAYDGHNILAMELECKIPDVSKITAWPAFWLFPNQNDPAPLSSGSTTSSEIDMMDLFTYSNNGSTNNFIATHGNSLTTKSDFYLHPSWSSGSLKGNNSGRKDRKIQFVWLSNKVYYYLDGVLIRASNFTYNYYKSAEVGVNLAIGSIKNSFHSNGYYPIDVSIFPLAYRIKRLRIWYANKNY